MEVSLVDPLLGTGRGIDHLIVGARDISEAVRQYQRVLGFSIVVGGRHPEGTENVIAHFKNGSYLELLGVYDRAKAAETAARIEKREGPIGLGLNVSSAVETAAYLRSRGFQVEEGSGTIKLEGVSEAPAVMWRWVDVKDKAWPYEGIFFIEYTEERERLRRNHPEKYPPDPKHPNSALTMESVWLAVKNLSEAASRFESLGFTPARKIAVPILQADAQEIKVGQGTILLLQPRSESEISNALNSEGEELCGVSIRVQSLTTARNMIEDKLNKKLDQYNGTSGPSILLGPEHTYGAWIEFHQ